MSILGGAHSTSISHSQLASIAGDQFNISNYNFDPSGKEKEDARSLAEERRFIVDWLTSLDFNSYQNEIFQSRAKGTGQWLLESKLFEKWRDGCSESLFCPGMRKSFNYRYKKKQDRWPGHVRTAGGGKTVITSIVVNHLQSRFEDDDKVATAYVYLSYKKQNQQMPGNLISCLLKQFIQVHTGSLDSVRTLYQRHEKRNSRPTLDEVTQALNLEISKYSKVFVVVDALDELSEDNGARVTFLEAIRSLPDSVNLMVTARDLPSIAVYFQETTRLEIFAHDQDVRKYVGGRIPRWYSKGLEATVTDEISKNADGMFLLARLHMDSLGGKHSAAQVSRALKKLPKGVDDTYDEALKRIRQQNEYDRTLAYRVLSWITSACRPLTVEELQSALAVVPGMTRLDPDEIIFEECLTSYCAGLVVIDEDSRVIRLVHYTTQEYFDSRRDVLFPEAQAEITRTCLTYLLFDDFDRDGSCDAEVFTTLLRMHPLLDYAARYWGRHAAGDVEETEKGLLLGFLHSPYRVDFSSRILLRELFWGYPPMNVTAMHLCTFFGLFKTFRHELENGAKADTKDGLKRTPLSWAVMNGHIEMVTFLLAGKNVDADSRDDFGITPLSLAAISGHHATVDALLGCNDVNVNSTDNTGETPLSKACRYMQHAVVARLLAHNAVDVNSKDINAQTPLSHAARNGLHSIVSLLMTHEAIDVNCKDNSGQSPLSLAATEGHQAVVDLLLAHEAVDVNSEDNLKLTPLSRAARDGHSTVVSLLLNRIAVNINCQDNLGLTPLAWAASKGHDAVVALLLAHEAIDINLDDKTAQTPLCLAACAGHDAIVQRLLAHPAIIVNSIDLYGWSPLSWAAWKGHSAVVIVLLSHENIDVSIRDGEEWTPLSRAIQHGYDGVVACLLSHEVVDVNSKDQDIRTPLSLAAELGHDTIVEFLLAHEAIDVNCRDRNGLTPLSYAVMNNHDVIVQLLLSNGAVDPIQEVLW